MTQDARIRISLLAVITVLLGCQRPPPPAPLQGTASPSSSSRATTRLIWNDAQKQWDAVALAGGGRISLATTPLGECSMLRTATDARVLHVDLEGATARKHALVMWSESMGCLVLWPRDPRTPAAIYSLSCQVPTLCTASRLGEEPDVDQYRLVAVLRGHELVQLLHDRALSIFGPLELLDVTFDDAPDLVVPTGNGCTGNCRVNVWPYDPAARRFVASPSLADLSNISLIDGPRRWLASQVCLGMACTLFESRLLEVTGTTARVVAVARQRDVTPGSLEKRLEVNPRDPAALHLACEAIVDSSGAILRKIAGACGGWPRPTP